MWINYKWNFCCCHILNNEKCNSYWSHSSFTSFTASLCKFPQLTKWLSDILLASSWLKHLNTWWMDWQNILFWHFLLPELCRSSDFSIKNIGWIAIKFSPDIHAAFKIHCNSWIIIHPEGQITSGKNIFFFFFLHWSILRVWAVLLP